MKRVVTWPLIVVMFAISLYMIRLWVQTDRFGRIRFEENLSAIMLNDPKVGAIIWPDADTKNLPNSFILICAAMCTCDADSLRYIDNRSPSLLPVLVMAPTHRKEFEALSTLASFEHLFLFDPEFKYIDKLNAKFLPRGYLITNGRLAGKYDALETDWLKLIALLEKQASRKEPTS